MDRRTWLACASALALAFPVGCGDDDAMGSDDGGVDAGEEPSAGRSGSSGRGGAGGRRGEAGRGGSGEEGGSGGRGGAGGEGGASGEGGEGGESGQGGQGGGGGQGGDTSDDDAGIETSGGIDQVADRVFTQANDLRGLTYAADGKIYASGYTDSDMTNRRLVIARFLANGEPDTSFDGDGFLVYDVGPGDEQSLGLVELSDGDIVVQANVTDAQGGDLIPDANGGEAVMRPSGQNVVLLRFDSSGQLVTSFGDNGIALVTFGWAEADDASWPAPTFDSSLPEREQFSTSGFPSDTGWGIRLDSSGSEEKLVVPGFGPAKKVDADQRYDNDRYVARLLASTGAPDPQWNGGSAFTFNTLSDFNDGARRAIVEEDGTVVSSGYTNFGPGYGNHVVLLRLQPDGTPDPDFGFGIALPGVTRFNPFVDDGGMAEAYGVARQSNGRYVTTGYGRATGTGTTSKYGYATTDSVDLVSFAVEADGSGLDTEWGTQGTLAVQSEELGLAGTEERGRDLIVLADDRVVHAGRFAVGPALIVTTPDGQLDTSVSGDGIISYTPFESMPSHFYAIAQSQDGRHVAATTNNHPSGVLLAVLEVEAD